MVTVAELHQEMPWPLPQGVHMVVSLSLRTYNGSQDPHLPRGLMFLQWLPTHLHQFSLWLIAPSYIITSILVPIRWLATVSIFIQLVSTYVQRRAWWFFFFFLLSMVSGQNIQAKWWGCIRQVNGLSSKTTVYSSAFSFDGFAVSHPSPTRFNSGLKHPDSHLDEWLRLWVLGIYETLKCSTLRGCGISC